MRLMNRVDRELTMKAWVVAGAAMLLLHLTPVHLAAQAGKVSTPIWFAPQQTHLLLGPTVGVNYNNHSGGFRTVDEPGCPIFEDGSGWGFSVGLSAEVIPLPDSRWSFVPRVTFEQRPGEFHQDLPNVQVLLGASRDTGGSQSVLQTVSTTSDITYTLLNTELLYRYELLRRGRTHLSVLGGPAMQLVLGGTNRQVQDLEEPQNARFTNPTGLKEELNGRRLVFYEGEIEKQRRTRFSMKAGVQVELELADRDWELAPGIFYDYGFTDVTAAESWKLSSVMLQVDLRRAF